MSDRRFPIQGDRKTGEPPTTVPWSEAELAYRTYYKLFGGDQTLERLAERGGFGPSEFRTLRAGFDFNGRKVLDLPPAAPTGETGKRGEPSDALREDVSEIIRRCNDWIAHVGTLGGHLSTASMAHLRDLIEAQAVEIRRLRAPRGEVGERPASREEQGSVAVEGEARLCYVDGESAELLADGPREAVARIVVEALADQHRCSVESAGYGISAIAEPDADDVTERIFAALAPPTNSRPSQADEPAATSDPSRELRRALDAYEADPIDARDRPSSWGKLAALLAICRALALHGAADAPGAGEP